MIETHPPMVSHSLSLRRTLLRRPIVCRKAPPLITPSPPATWPPDSISTQITATWRPWPGAPVTVSHFDAIIPFDLVNLFYFHEANLPIYHWSVLLQSPPPWSELTIDWEWSGPGGNKSGHLTPLLISPPSGTIYVWETWTRQSPGTSMMTLKMSLTF